ncbi:Prp18 domain containing protein [Novymonas esmeraldas]|uniref:Pre-mRNA-splicing factor 18 n=1 Tax=Novymonas esmeraldas TaxID=1808958 RepID=A0AAW0ER24_9TRYP
MNFEGLQGLLKKKKQQPSCPTSTQPTTAAAAVVGPSPPSPPLDSRPVAAATATATATDPSSSSGNRISPSVSADPYAAALQHVQQRAPPPPPTPPLQQQQQQQQQTGEAPHSSTATAGHKRGRVEEEMPCSEGGDDDGVTARSALPALKSSDDVAAEREAGVAVLQRCLDELERCWAAERAPKNIVTAASAPLPRALGDYLITHFVTPTSAASGATGVPEMVLLEQEFGLLAELRAETEALQEAKVPAGTAADPAAVTEEQRHLAELLRALWYLVALRWQCSLAPNLRRGGGGGASSAAAAAVVATPSRDGGLRGWSHAVYLALHNALPADMRLVHGRAIAEEVDSWRALARSRRDALELLAYVYSDYASVAAADASSPAAALIIPVHLREQLHVMVVCHLQRQRHFMATRQAYVDITMGTANWKLGLFSGGEVHMRRSMERVERSRIAHLLNNEHATRLLQAVRELTTFAEQHSATTSSGFFAAAAARANTASDTA